MPRASSSAKRTQGANNTRDTRHENGLVGPGRRIVKQKSQTQLDGSPRSSAAADITAVPPLPATTLLAAAATTSAANGSAKQNGDMAPEHRAPESLRRISLGTYSGSSSTDSLPVPLAQPVPEENHRRIDVNDAKNTNVHRDPGPLELAVTVLRSCPLHDTIAILIILMQVPPVALATIYMLFTLLTFVPPVQTSSGLSITEIFDGNQGTPSLTTLICMDVIMLLVWLFLWAPMQQFILDLAQVVISLTLGGGGSSRQGTANNIFLCVAIVGFSQWSRHLKLTGLSHFSSLIGSNRLFSPDPNGPLESTVRAFEKKGPYGWVRSILAIHILTQGLVRYIREWYLRREKRDLQSQSQQDPEAGKSTALTSSEGADLGFTTGDTDVSVQPTLTNISSKKRRKQSAQVRIRQPLWAALASTKIVMVKEYELSHAASESAGSNATDIHNLGNAPFNTQPEQIWICYVGCDEVCFNTSHFPDVSDSSDEDAKLGFAASKPFYVKVNKAIWQPTRIIPIDAGEEEAQQGTRWTGDIYGLTPMSNYECEFISTQTGEVLFSTSVRTTQAKTKDLDATSKATPRERSQYRHDSPATTLRASIAMAEAKLAEEKSRLKAVRKDNNRRVNAAKKEIEKLTSSLSSTGNGDDKLSKKITQNKTQEKQALASISDLEKELKALDTVPEELLNQYRTKQSVWSAEKSQFDGARASFKSFKASIEKELKTLENEQSKLQAQRNKIATRIAKVDGEHARITDANARGLDEAERRRQVRAVQESDILRTEQHISDKIAAMRAYNSGKQGQIHDMAHQLQAYISTFENNLGYEQTTSPNQYTSVPSVPWGPPAGHYEQQAMWPPASMPSQAPALLPPPQLSSFPHPLHALMGTPLQIKSRGRSSSMLSDVSGFTQSTDDDDRVAPGVIGRPNIGLGRSGIHGTPAPALRGPPGFAFSASHHQRGGDEGSGSGSSGSGLGSGSGSLGSGLGSGRSSVRSGSGSGASVKDPTSPV